MPEQTSRTNITEALRERQDDEPQADLHPVDCTCWDCHLNAEAEDATWD